MQGMKKIEEIFNQKAKAVEDLLHIAKVFFLLKQESQIEERNYTIWHCNFLFCVYTVFMDMYVYMLYVHKEAGVNKGMDDQA